MADSAERVLADAIRSVAAGNGQEPTALLEELGARAESLLGCDSVSIYVLDTRDGEPRLRAARVSALNRASGLPADLSWVADAPTLASMYSGQIEFVERFQLSPDLLAAWPWLVGIASTLCAPLAAGDEPLGLLVAHWRSPRRSDPTLLAHAGALADCVALTLETARLRAEAARAGADRERLAACEAESARLADAIKSARRITHELNNQLSPIRGYSEVLAEMLEDEPAMLAERIVRGSEASAASVARLQRVIRI